jgi:chromosome segregation ATPase
MAEEKKIDDDMSDLMKQHVREVSAQGLAGQVKVLSKRALKDIIDTLIKSYGGLQHQDLIAKIAEYELQVTQLNQKMTQMGGKMELLQAQNAELQSRDDELRASAAVDASKLPMLEEQNATLKKTLEGLEAEKKILEQQMEELRSSLGSDVETLRAELAELKPKYAEMVEKYAEVGKLHEEMDATRLRFDREIGEKDEHIERLQKALDESDAKRRIAELETEVKELKKTVHLLEIGLEHVDALADIRPDELLAKVEQARGAAAGGMAARLDLLKTTLEEDAKAYPKLLEAMNANKGSIQVMSSLAQLLARQAEIRAHIETIGGG